MDYSSLLLTLIFDLFFTAVIYLLIPVILCFACRKKLSNKQIITIAIINGAILWMIFMIIRINAGEEGTSAAVFLWSSIAYGLMRKNCLKIPDDKQDTNNKNISEYISKKCNEYKNSESDLKAFLVLCRDKKIITDVRAMELYHEYINIDTCFNTTEILKNYVDYVLDKCKKYMTDICMLGTFLNLCIGKNILTLPCAMELYHQYCSDSPKIVSSTPDTVMFNKTVHTQHSLSELDYTPPKVHGASLTMGSDIMLQTPQKESEEITDSVDKNDNRVYENNETIFCRKCGKKILSDSEFCHKCGTKVEIPIE